VTSSSAAPFRFGAFSGSSRRRSLDNVMDAALADHVSVHEGDMPLLRMSGVSGMWLGKSDRWAMKTPDISLQRKSWDVNVYYTHTINPDLGRKIPKYLMTFMPDILTSHCTEMVNHVSTLKNPNFVP
jgi:hypothetical protein